MLTTSPTVLPRKRPAAPPEVSALIRPLSRRDNRLNWLFLTFDWAVIGAALAVHLMVPGPVVYLLALIIIGSRMRALANLVHEAAHLKLFGNRQLNDGIGRALCALPIFINYRRYVADHKRHHRNLWRNDGDPDLLLYQLTDTVDATRGRGSFAGFVVKHVVLVVVPVMPWWRLWRESRRDPARLLVLGLLALAGAGLVVAAPAPLTDVVVFGWLVPWLTSFQSITYWAELGEHGGLRKHGWSWGSRNWRGNAVTRWVIGSHSDDQYHLLHHWFPSVPHYRLRSLDTECRSRWLEYRDHARCSGFFVGNGSGASVLTDIWRGGEEE